VSGHVGIGVGCQAIDQGSARRRSPGAKRGEAGSVEREAARVMHLGHLDHVAPPDAFDLVAQDRDERLVRPRHGNGNVHGERRGARAVGLGRRVRLDRARTRCQHQDHNEPCEAAHAAQAAASRRLPQWRGSLLELTNRSPTAHASEVAPGQWFLGVRAEDLTGWRELTACGRRRRIASVPPDHEKLTV
jgi:hypothetical protein